MKRKLYLFIILLIIQSYSSWQDSDWRQLFNMPIGSIGEVNSDNDGTLWYNWRLQVPYNYDTTTIGPLLKHASYVATRESKWEKIRDSVIIYDDRPVYWWRYKQEYDNYYEIWDTINTAYYQELNDSLVEYLWDLLEDTDSLPSVKRVTQYLGEFPVLTVNYEIDEDFDSAWTFKLYEDEYTVFTYNSSTLLDSVIRYSFHEDSGKWIESYLTNYSWNDNKKITARSSSYWGGSSWGATYTYLYTYSADGNCSTYTYLGNSIPYNYKFDDQNRQIEGYATYPFKIYYIDSTVQIEQKMNATWSAGGDTMISLTFFKEIGEPSNSYLLDSTHKVLDGAGNIVSRYNMKIGWRWQEVIGGSTIEYVIEEADTLQYLWEFSYNADGMPIERIKKSFRDDAWEIDTIEIISWLDKVSKSSASINKHSPIAVEKLGNGLSVKFTTPNQNAKFRLTDLKGRVVDAATITSASLKSGWQWKAGNLASGLYLYRVSYKGCSVNGKVLIRR